MSHRKFGSKRDDRALALMLLLALGLLILSTLVLWALWDSIS